MSEPTKEDMDIALGLGDDIYRELDNLWGHALDVSNSRDFRIFSPDEDHVDGGGELDEDKYIRAKANIMRHVRERLDRLYGA